MSGDKAALRDVMRHRLRELTAEDREAYSEEICERVLEMEQWADARSIVVFTPLVLGLFTWLARRKREPNTPVKIGSGMWLAGLSSLLMVFALMSTIRIRLVSQPESCNI